DEPLYTVSAHVRCTDIVPLQKGTGGVGIQITCYEDGGLLRRIRTPYATGTSGGFVEQTTSFCVPQGTSRIEVRLILARASGTAFFDNVKLTTSSIPRGQLVSSPGVRRAVDAPEPGTFVNAGEFRTLQQAVNSVATGETNDGKILWIPEGRYRVDRLILRSGVSIKMHRQTVLIRTSDGVSGGGFDSAFLRTPDDEKAESNVTIEGGRYQCNGKSGRFLDWHGHRWIVRNVFVPTWANPGQFAKAISWRGNDSFLYNNTIAGPGGLTSPGQRGYGGLIMSGGRGAYVSNNRIESGDDAIGLFTTTVPFTSTGKPIPTFNRDIEEVEVFNNVLNSKGGRAFACGLAVPRDDNVTLTCRVEDIRVRNCFGTCGGTGHLLTIQSVPKTGDSTSRVSSARVEGITIANVRLSGDLAVMRNDAPAEAGWLSKYKQWGIYLYSAGGGSLRDVHIDNVRISNTVKGPLRIRRTGIGNRNIRITGCTLNSVFSEPLRNPVTNQIRRQSQFMFLVEAERPVELNSFDNSNRLVGPGIRCWDADSDGVCDE
ncbi:MAG: hypothetical protein AAF456_26050, partial [Planctomycetota bacterium]